MTPPPEFTPARLLVVCHGFPPYYGGAEHAAYYLAREAVAGGTAVAVLTSDIGGRLPREELMNGMRVVRVPVRKREWTRHTVSELAGFLRSASRRAGPLVAALRPDRILAHFSLPAGEVARRLRLRFGVPYAVVLHGSDVPGYQPRRFGALYPVTAPFVRRVWRQAEAVIAVSGRLRDLALSAWPEGAIEVIENGVDTVLFRPGEHPAREPLRIVTVAQLIERKGIHVLLDALAALGVAGGPRPELHVYGTGPFRRVLETRAGTASLGGRVFFHGLVSRQDLARGLREETDLFVLPSLEEGLPLALLEAMASGLPVIATRVGGVPGLLADGRDALLVAPGNVDELAAAVRRAATDPDLRVRLAREARATAERHSWASVWQRYRERLGPVRPAGAEA